ncbi:MAG: SH3 domain-containing protein [Caldilineaceae bacterium]
MSIKIFQHNPIKKIRPRLVATGLPPAASPSFVGKRWLPLAMLLLLGLVVGCTTLPTIRPASASVTTGATESPDYESIDYENSVGGFTLQYPASALRLDDAQISVDGALAQMTNTVTIQNNTLNYALTITWFDLTDNTSLSTLVANHSQCAAVTAVDGEPYQLAGNDALFFPDVPCGPFGATYIFTVANGRGYRIIVATTGAYADIRSAVEEVLSTLQFQPPHSREMGPALCPTPTDQSKVLIDGAHGYCLLYPAPYVVVHTDNNTLELVQQSLLNSADPRVSIQVEDAAAQTLAAVADQLVADYTMPGMTAERGSVTVDGVEAIVLDKLPGKDLNRRVVFIRDGWLYSLFFTPLGETDAAQAALENFYQTLLDSWRFLGQTPLPLPQPESADVMSTTVQYIQALVNVNIRSGPSTDYGIVGRVAAGQFAQVTGVMPNDGWWRVRCPDGSIGNCFMTSDPTLTQATDTSTAAPTLPADSGTDETVIERLETVFVDRAPFDMNAVIYGLLPDACAFVERAITERTGNTFRIQLVTARQPNQRCAPMQTAFEHVVPLGMTELPTGEYTVVIGNLRQSFQWNGPESSAPVLPTDVTDIQALQTVTIYNAPSSDAPVIGELQPDEYAGVAGLSPDGQWWRIQCAVELNSECWVAADPAQTQPVTADESTSTSAIVALLYRGPQEMGAEDASKCAGMSLDNSQQATLVNCDGSTQVQDLGKRFALDWVEIQTRFAPFTYTTPTEKIAFIGTGTTTGEAWQRAILAWARVTHAELATGRASATGRTVLSWFFAPLAEDPALCTHLTVLNYGYAYAETANCEGGEVVDARGGWLTDSELVQFDQWLYNRAPLYVDNNYLDGQGEEPMNESESTAVAQWASDVWARLWAAGTPAPNTP